VGWKPTLGSAALAGEGAGVCLVGAGWAAATAKMSASFWMVSLWASPMDGCEGGGRGRVAEGPSEVDGCTNGSIGGGELRHFAVVRKKLHRAGDAFCSGFGGIDLVAPVVFRCSSQIPSIGTMDGPSSAAVWCFMDEDLRAVWCEGCFIVIEGAVELCFSGESWIYAGWSHEV
jgi:hypothetical protein